MARLPYKVTGSGDQDVGIFVWVCWSLSRLRIFVTPSAVAHQAPLPMDFPRLEYWSGCHFVLQRIPDPGIEPSCPESGIEPSSPESPALADGFFTIWATSIVPHRKYSRSSLAALPVS